MQLLCSSRVVVAALLHVCCGRFAVLPCSIYRVDQVVSWRSASNCRPIATDPVIAIYLITWFCVNVGPCLYE